MLINAVRHNTVKFRGNATAKEDPPSTASQRSDESKSNITSTLALTTGGALIGGGMNCRYFSNKILNPEVGKMAAFNVLAQNSGNRLEYATVANALSDVFNEKFSIGKDDLFTQSVNELNRAAKEAAKKAGNKQFTESTLLPEKHKSIKDLLKHKLEKVGDNTVINTSLGSIKGDFDGLKGEFQFQAKDWLKNDKTRDALLKSFADVNKPGNGMPNELADSIVRGIQGGDISQVVNDKILQNSKLRKEFIDKNPVLRTYKRLLKIDKTFAKGTELEKKIIPQASGVIKDAEKLYGSEQAKMFEYHNGEVNQKVVDLLKGNDALHSPENKLVLSENVLKNFENMDADTLFKLSDESGIAAKLKSTEQKVVEKAEKAYLPEMLTKVSMMQRVDTTLTENAYSFSNLPKGNVKKTLAKDLADLTEKVFDKLPESIKAGREAAGLNAGKYFETLLTERRQLAGELKSIKDDPAKMAKTVSKHVCEFFTKEKGIDLNKLGIDAAKHVKPVKVGAIKASYYSAASEAASVMDLKAQKLSKELGAPISAGEEAIKNKVGYGSLVSRIQKKSKVASTLKASLVGAGVGLAAAGVFMLKKHLSNKAKETPEDNA